MIEAVNLRSFTGSSSGNDKLQLPLVQRHSKTTSWRHSLDKSQDRRCSANSGMDLGSQPCKRCLLVHMWHLRDIRRPSDSMAVVTLIWGDALCWLVTRRMSRDHLSEPEGRATRPVCRSKRRYTALLSHYIRSHGLINPDFHALSVTC